METKSGAFIQEDLEGRIDFEPNGKETLELRKKKYISVDDFIEWFEESFDIQYGTKGHGFFIKESWKPIMEEYKKLKNSKEK